MIRRARSFSFSEPIFGLEKRVFPAGHDGQDEIRTGPESGRHFRRLDHAEPAAGAGTDKHNPPAFPQRLRDDFDADANALLLAVHRGEHLAVFIDHLLDDVGGREPVDRQGYPVDGFGWNRPPPRPYRHSQTTSGNTRAYSNRPSR